MLTPFLEVELETEAYQASYLYSLYTSTILTIQGQITEVNRHSSSSKKEKQMDIYDVELYPHSLLRLLSQYTILLLVFAKIKLL